MLLIWSAVSPIKKPSIPIQGRRCSAVPPCLSSTELIERRTSQNKPVCGGRPLWRTITGAPATSYSEFTGGVRPAGNRRVQPRSRSALRTPYRASTSLSRLAGRWPTTPARLFCGPRGIRTLDLLNAIETRSQLRYGPIVVNTATEFYS